MKPTASPRSGFALSGALAGIVLLAPAAGLFACGGGKPADSPASASAGGGSSAASASASPTGSEATAAPPPASAAPASASAPPQAAPLGAVLMTDATVVQKLFDAATASPAATSKAGGASGGDPLAKGVRDLAKQQATGMEADGPLATGNLKEKQHLQRT